MACFSEDLKCWEAWDTTCRHKTRDITPLITWRRERWKEEALDDFPWKDERGPSSIRQTLEPFQRWHCGNFWDRVERIWDFLSAWIPSWTELSWQWLDALTSWWTHSNGFNAWLWLTDLFSFILFNHYYFLKVDSSLQQNLGHSNCVLVIMMQREYLVISSRKPWTFPLFFFNFLLPTDLLHTQPETCGSNMPFLFIRHISQLHPKPITDQSVQLLSPEANHRSVSTVSVPWSQSQISQYSFCTLKPITDQSAQFLSPEANHSSVSTVCVP